MSNLLNVTILRLYSHRAGGTQVAPKLKLSFISEEALELHLLRPDKRHSILAKVEKELQRVSDQRFGPSVVRVKCKSLKSGSLVIIVTLGVMSYKFFKDYHDLRVGVTLFIEDLNKVGKKLHELLFTECRNALREASARLSRKVSEQTSEQLQELQRPTPRRYLEVVQPFQYGTDEIKLKIPLRVKSLIDTMKVKSTPAADERAKLSVRERIALKSIQSRGLTLRELAEEIGLSVEKSRYLIGRLRAKGLVVEANRSGREKRWRKRQDSLRN